MGKVNLHGTSQAQSHLAIAQIFLKDEKKAVSITLIYGQNLEISSKMVMINLAYDSL